MRLESKLLRKGKPRLVAIVGGSGAGKSWLARELQQILGKEAARISLDDFYLDRSHLSPAARRRINFDHPRAIDWPRFEKVLRDCSKGNSICLPRYDFMTHCQKCEGVFVSPKPVFLFDGLWLLRSPQIRRFFDFTIFLECPHTLRLRRRLARDCAERGRAEALVQAQFAKTVAPMHNRFVEPQTHWADIVFSKPPTAREVKQLAERIKLLVREL